MSIWNIFGSFATSDQGETITKVSKDLAVSSRGVTYTTMGDTTFGSDGSVFTQQGPFSTDGSTRMGNIATGVGSIFNDNDDRGCGHRRDPFDI